MQYYHLYKPLRDVFNQSAIFISPSIKEGFGLPVFRSYELCGCAVIVTDIDGHKDFAFENETALTVPIKDSEALFAKLVTFIENDILRTSIANKGNELAKNFQLESLGRQNGKTVYGAIGLFRESITKPN
jgi:glycosyltransferase involved in cell wall biosynthesis